jgi:hypothetical protein
LRDNSTQIELVRVKTPFFWVTFIGSIAPEVLLNSNLLLEKAQTTLLQAAPLLTLQSPKAGS